MIDPIIYSGPRKMSIADFGSEVSVLLLNGKQDSTRVRRDDKLASFFGVLNAPFSGGRVG